LAKVTGLFQKSSEAASDDKDNDPDGKNKLKKTFTPMSQVRATILNSWINVLLIACESYPSSDISILTMCSPGRDRALLCPCKAGRGFRGQFHCYHPSCGNA
jgi:hypothetical protein